jgi:hypothetical protein
MENILGRDKEIDMIREELEAYLASWQVYIILYHTILYYIILYYIILYHIILYYIILYYVVFGAIKVVQPCTLHLSARNHACTHTHARTSTHKHAHAQARTSTHPHTGTHTTRL